MKILIVNGFQDNSKGTETFLAFQAIIYNIFKLESHLVDTEIEFYVRSLSKLDDLLYEMNSNFTKKSSASNFDTMDMIFVAGDSRLYPWS